MYTRRGGDSTAGSFPNGKRLAKPCATATGGIHPPLGKRVSAPQVIVFVAPQVDVPILGWYIAGTSAGATGGKLKPTPAVEAIAPQVNVSTAGKHRPARTEDRR